LGAIVDRVWLRAVEIGVRVVNNSGNDAEFPERAPGARRGSSFASLCEAGRRRFGLEILRQ
jgi:hypothetical protein